MTENDLCCYGDAEFDLNQITAILSLVFFGVGPSLPPSLPPSPPPSLPPSRLHSGQPSCGGGNIILLPPSSQPPQLCLRHPSFVLVSSLENNSYSSSVQAAPCFLVLFPAFLVSLAPRNLGMIHTTVNVYTIPRVWQQNYPPLRVALL